MNFRHLKTHYAYLVNTCWSEVNVCPHLFAEMVLHPTRIDNMWYYILPKVLILMRWSEIYILWLTYRENKVTYEIFRFLWRSNLCMSMNLQWFLSSLFQLNTSFRTSRIPSTTTMYQWWNLYVAPPNTWSSV